MKKTRALFFSAVLIITVFYLVADSANVTESIKNSINVCLSVIIPSLFAFMTISDLMLTSGAADRIFLPLYRISPWFKGGEALFSVFLLSLFGGYPIGISLLSSLIAHNKNYSEISKKILPFCYCPSPTFVIGIIGLQLYGRADVGIAVYAANALACSFIMLIVNTFFLKNYKLPFSAPPENRKSISLLLTDSIVRSMKSLSVVCGVIIVFNIILGIPAFFGIETNAFFRSLLELSNVSLFEKGDYSLLPALSALTSLGGVCIIFQTAAIGKGSIKLSLFLIMRVPAALLSALFCNIIIRVFNITLPVATEMKYNFIFSPVNPLCSICLIIMTCFLLIFSKKNTEKQ